MGSMVNFQRPDGQSLQGYLATPVQANAPAVVVIQEWWGLNDQIRGVADRLAAAGFQALEPDLYRGQSTVEAEEAHHLMSGLNFGEAASQDIRGAVQYLKTRASKVGVTGFCMGGSYALMLPCVNEAIKAAVPFYGQVPNPDTPLQKLSAPVLYFYGEDDGWITKADVQRLTAALKKYNKSGEIKIYPGAPHAFFRDNDPSVYRPEAAKDAWARTKGFFKQHLG